MSRLELDQAIQAPSRYLTLSLATESDFRGPQDIIQLLSTDSPSFIALGLSATNELYWHSSEAPTMTSPDIESPAEVQTTLPLIPEQSHCLELLYSQESTQLRVYLDDLLVPGLDVDNNLETGFDEVLLTLSGGELNLANKEIHLLLPNGLTINNVTVTKERVGCAQW